MTSGSPLLVDLRQASALLSVSSRAVQQLVYDGHLPSVKVGRRRLIASADLEAFVDRLRQEGTRPADLAVVSGGRK